jgi:hypothetical protein
LVAIQKGLVVVANRILAVAIGSPASSISINTRNPAGVRKYINGLIDFLAQPDAGNSYNIGQDYYIDYYECYEGDIDFPTMTSAAPPAVIFCMSTPIVRSARDFTDTIPIVGVFSDAL